MLRRVPLVLAAFAVALAGLAGNPPTAQAAATGTFSVLTYNVAGLPEIISSASTPRAASTTEIGRRLGPYDIVNVQEDFNYHAYLYATDTHPYRTPTNGGAGIGSGLNSLSAFPYDEDDFERVRWDSCQFDSGDCLTPKGFSFMRTRLAEGAYLDVYNLHTNAGTSSGDLASRADNLRQLSAFIKGHSAGHAVLVMGDTNTRYTRSGDTIAAFARDNGLTDAWVQLKRGGSAPAAGSPALVCEATAITDNCEVVDKILYRGSRLISLNATSYHNEHAAFLDPAGAMLSDHDPVSAGFQWQQNPAFQLSEQFGGPHGDPFDDIDQVPADASGARRVDTVFVRTGARVDLIGVKLADGMALAHGGSGGTYSSLTLQSAEYLTSATLCQGKYNDHTRIFSVTFRTSQGRSLSGGFTTSSCVTRTAPPGWGIEGFHGRSGDEVDKIGFIYAQR